MMSVGTSGIVASRNITPAGIGDWTDQQIRDVLTTGVGRDGRPLHPAMSARAPGLFITGSDMNDLIAFKITLPAATVTLVILAASTALVMSAAGMASRTDGAVVGGRIEQLCKVIPDICSAPV